MSYLYPVNYEAYSRRNDGGLPEELKIRQYVISSAVETLLRATPAPVAAKQPPSEERMATVTNIATRQIIDREPENNTEKTVADAPVTDVLSQIALAQQNVEDVWKGIERHDQIRLQSAPTPIDNNYLDDLQTAA